MATRIQLKGMQIKTNLGQGNPWLKENLVVRSGFHLRGGPEGKLS